MVGGGLIWRMWAFEYHGFPFFALLGLGVVISSIGFGLIQWAVSSALDPDHHE